MKKKTEKGAIFRPFTFLDLPTEVRVSIYELLFARHRLTWRWSLRPDSWRFVSDESKRRFSILGTCSSVHAEANRVLYRLVKFTCYVDDAERKAFAGMLDSLSPTLRLDLITSLHIDIGMRWDAVAHVARKSAPQLLDWSALRHFPGLTTVEVLLLDDGRGKLALEKWDARERTWLQHPLVVTFVRSLVRALRHAVDLVAQSDEHFREIMYPRECYLTTCVMREFLRELDFSERGRGAPRGSALPAGQKQRSADDAAGSRRLSASRANVASTASPSSTIFTT